ncbi:MAG: glycerol dehydrogenase [Deltaproteobacteria bacterium]|nr:glycerol dehydrogenase [Deltaproteobacteria bacterium]
MSTKILIAPMRYVQGPDALTQIGQHLEGMGVSNPLVIGGPTALGVCRETMAESMKDKGIGFDFVEFGGECTFGEIQRIKDACISGSHDAIIACGGGKVLDTGRTASAGNAVNAGVVPPEMIEGIGANVPCIQVPTIAATDAPTAKVSVIYNDKGEFETFLVFQANPAMVFVDTQIIANAPAETLVSGMGDALSTYFEAAISYQTASPVLAGGLSTRTAQMMARFAFDTLMEYGVQAKIEAENSVVGQALEAVVEANILLSGLGYESGGLAAAHAIALSWTRVYDLFEVHPTHGQFVAFSTLTQLMLEGRNAEFLDKIYGFCRSIGLPTTFEELGLKNAPDEAIRMVAEDASKSVLITSMPRATGTPDQEGKFYDPNEIFNCLKAADAYGRRFG